MSSTWPLPLRMSISTLSTSMMSDICPYCATRRLDSSSVRELAYLQVVENAGAENLLAADAAVELHAPDRRQVVALGVEEQVGEQVLGRILGRRLAGSHHAVDLHQRLEARLGGIDAQRVGDVGAAVEIVHVQRVDLRDTGLDQLLDRCCGQHLVRLGEDLAGVGVDHVVRQHLAVHVLTRHAQARRPWRLRAGVRGGR